MPQIKIKIYTWLPRGVSDSSLEEDSIGVAEGGSVLDLARRLAE
jgi:hypothetical protein